MEKRYEVKFYVGTETDKVNNSIPRHYREAALNDVREILATAFFGFTEYEHYGAWQDSSSAVVREAGITFVVITEELTQVSQVARDIRMALLQTSVLVTRSEVFAEFI